MVLRLLKVNFSRQSVNHIDLRAKRTFTREYFTVMTCMIGVNQLCVCEKRVPSRKPLTEQYLKCLEKAQGKM